MNNDDKSWLDGLAGRDNDSPAAQEGRLLQRAMRQRAVTKTSEPATSHAREVELIARAMHEDQRTPEPRAAARIDDSLHENDIASDTRTAGARTPGKALLPSWLFGSGGMLALASVAIAAIVVSLLLPVTQEETLRGVAANELKISADDPGALRIGISEALLDLGVEVEAFSVLGDEFVAADLPQPLPPEIEAILARYNLPVPENGELRIRISTRE